MNPCISVVVPVYKVEQYIKECIDSILAQTFSDFELILVDDGSPDNCGKICDDYQKKDHRVLVVHKNNGGLPSARNAGLLVAKGRYITFIDSDDFVSLNFLESLYNNLITNGSDACMAKEIALFYNDNNQIEKEIIYTTKIINEYVDEDSFFTFCKSKGLCDLSTKLFKRELFTDLKFDERTGWGEDFLFMYYLSSIHPHKLTTEMNAVYYYRHLINQPSINRWQNKKMNVIIAELHRIYKRHRKEKKHIDHNEFVLFYESCFISRYRYSLDKFLVPQLFWLLPYRVSYFYRNKSFKTFMYSFFPYIYRFLIFLKSHLRG